MPDLENPPENVRQAFDAFMLEYVGELGSNKAIDGCGFSFVGNMDPNASEEEKGDYCITVLLYKDYIEVAPDFPKEYKGVKVFTKIVSEPDPYAGESCCGEGCVNC